MDSWPRSVPKDVTSWRKPRNRRTASLAGSWTLRVIKSSCGNLRKASNSCAEVVEDEAGTFAGRRVEELHGVGEAAGIPGASPMEPSGLLLGSGSREVPIVRKPSLLLVLPLALMAVLPATAAPPTVSEFGKYSGYSEAVYDGWVRSSRYVPMRDGIRLAVDIVRPTLHGRVATERLPVVWTHTRYQRAFYDVSFEGMKVYSAADADDRRVQVVRHGYVVAAVDARGTGASFGTYMGWFSSDETRDGYDVTEWLAAQPWSNGNVGMYGRSYLGFTQYF